MAFEHDPFRCFVGTPFEQPGAPGQLRVAVKDNIDVAGHPTGAGLGRPGPIAARDAPIVTRLRLAGFTLIGKMAMDEIALGATGDNQHHGRTENPAAPGHSPGGSSSGPAAAVAAGYADAALGTDTLGSVRIPAAYCGLVGFKPSRALLPTAGIVPLSWTLDHPGLIAPSVGVLRTLLGALADPAAADPPSPPFRLAVPTNLAACSIAPSVRALFDAALRRVALAGWEVTPVEVPAWDPGATRRAGLLLIEAEAAVIFEHLLASDDPALSPDIRALLAFGRDCGSARLVRALRTLRDTAAGLDHALERCDAIALPTVPAPAFTWGEMPPPGQADLTAPANFGGHPAISVPIGAASDGRPVGLQLIGRPGGDWTLLLITDALADLAASPAP